MNGKKNRYDEVKEKKRKGINSCKNDYRTFIKIKNTLMRENSNKTCK